MDTNEQLRQTLHQKGYFVVRRLPDRCPVCGRIYLRRKDEKRNIVALICVSCNTFETLVALKNQKYLTDGKCWELNGISG